MNERYKITVLDRVTGEEEEFDTNDLILMTFENGELSEYLFEFQTVNYESAMRKLEEETDKVRNSISTRDLN